MKKIVLTLILTAFVFGFNGDKNSVLSQSQESLDKAREILLKNTDLNTATIEIFKFLDDDFDISLMARLSFGKDYKTLKKDEQKRYTDAFYTLLQKDFIEKVSFYKNEKIIVEDVVLNGKKGVIKASLDYNGSKREITLNIFDSKNTNNWLIYDVIVDDISLIKSYKTQFNGLLSQMSFDEFLQKIAL